MDSHQHRLLQVQVVGAHCTVYLGGTPSSVDVMSTDNECYVTVFLDISSQSCWDT